MDKAVWPASYSGQCDGLRVRLQPQESVRGVAICWPAALTELLSRPGPLDEAAIRRTAVALAAALPQA